MVRNSQNKKDIQKDVFFVLAENRGWIRKPRHNLSFGELRAWIYRAGLSSEAAFLTPSPGTAGSLA